MWSPRKLLFSVVGPLGFLVVVYDLPDALKIDWWLYDDETKKGGENVAMELIQSGLDKTSAWAPYL